MDEIHGLYVRRLWRSGRGRGASDALGAERALTRTWVPL